MVHHQADLTDLAELRINTLISKTEGLLSILEAIEPALNSASLYIVYDESAPVQTIRVKLIDFGHSKLQYVGKPSFEAGSSQSSKFSENGLEGLHLFIDTLKGIAAP